MDLSAGAAKRKGPISQQERARRVAEGRCIYCGGLGHFVSNCPNNKRPRPAVMRGALLGPAAPRSEVSEEEEEELKDESLA